MRGSKAQTITLGGKKVGYGQGVFVIAEAGVNHNGKLATALKMVDAAARAGADAIKFQTFKAEDVVIAGGKMAAYQKKNIGKEMSQRAMLKRLELKESFYRQIVARCQKKRIMFLSTPHGGFGAVDFLHKLGVKAFKFGSGEINNFPLLEYAARLNKPMILGTGMATMSEVKEAIVRIKKAGNSKIIVLHCTTNYPCPPSQVNLAAMRTMMDELDVLVGYSDHTLGIQVPIMAATLGACLIEKHFTLDKDAPGPDHKASAEPDELEQMVKSANSVKTILGSSIKRPTKSEERMLKDVRKSVVSLRSIKKGEKFTKENIGIKRPGNGLPPKTYKSLLGKTARRPIKADSLLKRSDYD